jgi:hypothetical protein
MLSIPGHKENTNQNYISIRMTIINNTNNIKFWRGCGEKEHFYIAGGNVN